MTEEKQPQQSQQVKMHPVLEPVAKFVNFLDRFVQEKMAKGGGITSVEQAFLMDHSKNSLLESQKMIDESVKQAEAAAKGPQEVPQSKEEKTKKKPKPND